MPPTSNLLAFSVAALALIAVPGPSVLFIVSRGVALGRRAAVMSVLGNTAGYAVHVTAVAFGLAAIVERSAVVFTVLKLAGAAYLVHLGVMAIRNRRSLGAALDAATAPRSDRRLVGEAFVVGIANPKTIIFLAAILPQFVDRSAGPVATQLLVLGFVFMLGCLVCDNLWAFAAGTAGDRLAASPRRLERVGATSGIVMIALGARLALVGRPD